MTENGTQVESYSYDLNGNRNTTGYTTGTDNELTASPGTTYTYDADGNLISQTNTSSHVTTTYTYDYRNRLTEVTVGGTIMATYTYNALDQRIGIKDSGTPRPGRSTTGTSPDANPYADFNGFRGLGRGVRATSSVPARSTGRWSTRSWRGPARAGRRPGT